jgi:hypothetical protein
MNCTVVNSMHLPCYKHDRRRGTASPYFRQSTVFPIGPWFTT